MFYSVPYEYINRQVEVKISDDLIEIFFNHMRIALHKRLYGNFGQLSIIRDHMTNNHKLFVDQTPEAAFEWAERIDESTLNVIQYI